MGKRILEIEIPPLVASQYLAYCLAILQTKERTKDYYYTHYIQWTCHVDEKKHNLYLEFDNSSCFYCPEIEILWKAKADIKDIIQTIREYIDQGNFALIDGADVFYLEHTLGVQKSHYGHDFLAYGYDDEQGVIYMMAYSINKKLEKYACSQQAIVKAFSSEYIEEDFGCICPVKPRDDAVVKLDRKKIKEELENYLYKKNVMESKESYEVHGYDVYQCMLEYIKKMNSESFLLYPKDLRVFMEHKKAMLHRILRLEKDFPNEGFEEIAENYQKIYTKSQVFWTILLKYIESKNNKLLERLKNIILDIEEKEYPILKSLILML